jgi:hypothetical protein
MLVSSFAVKYLDIDTSYTYIYHAPVQVYIDAHAFVMHTYTVHTYVGIYTYMVAFSWNTS